MTEIDQLKKRISDSGPEGVPTAHIRDDYEPAGDIMINQLTQSGEYITRRDPDWRIYTKEMAPY